MEREEFIKKLSLGLITVCGASGLVACSKANTTPNSNSNYNGGGSTSSVNLSTSLLNVGDQVIIGGGNVLVFRISTGNTPNSFVATEAICPHQGGGLSWIPGKQYIMCNIHSSEYDDTGKVLQGPQNSSGTTRALKIYATSITGTTLTVTIA